MAEEYDYILVDVSPITTNKYSQQYARDRGGFAGWELGYTGAKQWSVYKKVAKPSTVVTDTYGVTSHPPTPEEIAYGQEQQRIAEEQLAHERASLEFEKTRQQQILEGVITTPPQPQPQPEVTTILVGEEAIGVSAGFAEKLQEAMPKIEHEASRAEQIAEGIITPTYKEPEILVVTPAEQPTTFTTTATTTPSIPMVTITPTTTEGFIPTEIQYSEFPSLFKEETIGLTRIGETIEVSSKLPEPLKGFVVEHEILHNIYPEESELEILGRGIFGKDVTTIITPDNKVLLPKIEEMVTTTATTKPLITTIETDPKAWEKLTQSQIGSLSLEEMQRTYESATPLQKVGAYATTLLSGKGGKLLASPIQLIASKISPDIQPLTPKEVVIERLAEIKAETTGEESKLELFGKGALESFKSPIVSYLVAEAGGFGIKAGTGILSSLSPTAGTILETGIGAVSLAKAGYELPELGASLYSGIKSGEIAEVSGKLLTIGGAVAGGIAGYKEAGKLFEPLPETIIEAPPEGKAWGIKELTIETEKLGKTGFLKEKIQADLVPIEPRPISSEDVFGGKFIEQLQQEGSLSFTAGKFEQKVIMSPEEMDITKLKTEGLPEGIELMKPLKPIVEYPSEPTAYKSVVDIFPEMKSPVTLMQKKVTSQILGIDEVLGLPKGSEWIKTEVLGFETGEIVKPTSFDTGLGTTTITKAKAVLPIIESIKTGLEKNVLKIPSVSGVFVPTELYIGGKETEEMVAKQNKAMVSIKSAKQLEFKTPTITGYGQEEMRVSGVSGIFTPVKNIITDLSAMYKDTKLEEKLKKEGKSLYVEAKSPLSGMSIKVLEPKTTKGSTKTEAITQLKKYTPSPISAKPISIQIKEEPTISIQFSQEKATLPSEKLKYPSPYSPPKRIIEEEEYYISPPGFPSMPEIISPIKQPTVSPFISPTQPITTPSSMEDIFYHMEPTRMEMITPITMPEIGEMPLVSSIFQERPREMEIITPITAPITKEISEIQIPSIAKKPSVEPINIFYQIPELPKTIKEEPTISIKFPQEEITFPSEKMEHLIPYSPEKPLFTILPMQPIITPTPISDIFYHMEPTRMEMITPITMPEIGEMPLVSPIFQERPREMEIITPITAPIIGELPSTTQVTSILEKPREREIPMFREIEIQKPRQRIITIQQPIQKRIVRPIVTTKPKITTRQKTRLAQIQIQQPFRPTTLMPPIITTKKGKRYKQKNIGKQAYSVLVRKAGKFIRVKTPPLTRQSALALGGKITGETELASFKLEPTIGRPVSIGRTFKPFMFRRPKGKSRLGRDVYIEKAKFRIDQPIELKEITYKGIQASKQRMKKPKIPKFKFGKVRKNALRL